MTWARKTVYCERPEILGVDLSKPTDELFDACM
jgi:hypothetical protein